MELFMNVYDGLQFELSTDHDEIQYTHEQNSVVWRNKLTTEEYKEREHLIGLEIDTYESDYDKNLGLYHFVLKDHSVPIVNSKFDQIVASCETRNRIGYIAEPGANELKEVVTPCIGSVYTLPHHRKKGYASKLISLVNQYWDKVLGKNSFITLYSEVGDYYSRFGYKGFEVLDNKMDVKADDSSAVVNESDYELLQMNQFQDLIALENELLKKELLKKTKTSNKKLIAMELNNNIFRWFHMRDRFTNSKLNKNSEQTTVAGARLRNDENDHVIWLHDWCSSCITILKLKFSYLESFKKLMALAHNEAKISKFHTVQIWNSGLGEDKNLYEKAHEYLKANYKGKFDQSNSTLPAARLPLQNVEFDWEFNDKWCWF